MEYTPFDHGKKDLSRPSDEATTWKLPTRNIRWKIAETSSFAQKTASRAHTPNATSSSLPQETKHLKRSRTGCRNCKARRIKCDESRPACSACLTYYDTSSKCSYILDTLPEKQTKRNTDVCQDLIGQDLIKRTKSRTFLPPRRENLLTPLATSHPDPFGTLAVPSNDLASYELLRSIFGPSDFQDVRRASIHEMNQRYLLECYHLQSRGPLSAFLAYIDASGAESFARPHPEKGFQQKHSLVAMSDMRLKLARPNAVNDVGIARMITHLFWVSVSAGDYTAAQAHLGALASIVGDADRTNELKPCSMPERVVSGGNLWTYDKASGHITLPFFMIPSTGPLGLCKQDMTPPGLVILHEQGYISPMLTKYAGCARFVLRIARKTPKVSPLIALDTTKYLLIVNWAWGAGFEPGSPFEEAIFTAVSLSFGAMHYSASYLSFFRFWVHRVYEIMVPILQRRHSSDRALAKAIESPKYALLLIWLALLLGQYAKKHVEKQFYAKVLCRSLETWSPAPGTTKDFGTTCATLESAYFWDRERFDPMAQEFWDHAMSS